MMKNKCRCFCKEHESRVRWTVVMSHKQGLWVRVGYKNEENVSDILLPLPWRQHDCLHLLHYTNIFGVVDYTILIYGLTCKMS